MLIIALSALMVDQCTVCGNRMFTNPLITSMEILTFSNLIAKNIVCNTLGNEEITHMICWLHPTPISHLVL